jgi:NADH dehydrogenase
MPSVLIAGGGFAGIDVSRRLARRLDRSWKITLVTDTGSHELLTRLPDLVVGALGPDKVRIPLSAVLPKRVGVLRSRVTDIDPTRRMIRLGGMSLEGDFLVIALGYGPAFHRVPGARKYGMTVRSVDGALRLQQRLQTTLESRGSTRVVIVGAGYTATEVAGWLMDPLAAFPRGSLEVHLIAEDARLLPQGNERLAREVQRVLSEKGVHCRLATSVRSVGPEGVRLRDGSHVPANIVVWAVSGQAAWPGEGRGLSFGRDRRIDVDEYMRAPRCQGVYVVGDCAAARDYRSGRVVPANAQLGLIEAEIAAKNILAEVAGRRSVPFRPLSLGEALDLGGSDGVAEVFGVVVRGRIALRVKKSALDRYLYGLGGTRLLRAYR